MNEPAQTAPLLLESDTVANASTEGDSLMPFLSRILAMLRGRLHYAIGLGIVLAVLAPTLVHWRMHPLYKSTGIIEIKPSLQRILYQSENSQTLPMFAAYVDAQVELIKSPRVIALAIDDPGWRALGRDSSPAARARFLGALTVSNPMRSQLIQVSFEDETPKAAAVAVEAVLNAYMRIYGERDSQEDMQRLKVLEERRTALTNQLAAVQKRILAVSEEFGTDSLDGIHSFKLAEQQRIESALKQVQVQVAIYKGSVGEEDAANGGAGADLFVESDPRVRGLLQNHQQLTLKLATTAAQLGESHRATVRARQELEAVASAVEAMRAEVASGVGAGDTFLSTASTVHQRYQELTRQQDQLERLHSVVLAETLDMGRKRLQLGALRDESGQIRERLDETKLRIEQLNVESAGSGRIEVISNADVPIEAVNAAKKKKMMMASVLGGGAAGLGLVILVGFLDQRVRSAIEVDHAVGAPRMLGMIPDLYAKRGPDETEMAREVAAATVHNIRNLLIGAGQGSAPVLAITSSAAGSGKTSLTLALGQSFAAAGKKTLLIDCDLRGARLSAVCAERAPIPGRNGSDDQEEGVSLPNKSGCKLVAALLNRTLHPFVGRTRWPELEVLDCHGASAADASTLTSDRLSQLFERARSSYDVVIVDTGPVPGTVETAAAAVAADQVVFVVSRGDRRSHVTYALNFLAGFGVHVAGYVFNRADLRGYGSSVSNLSWSISRSRSRAGGSGPRSEREVLMEALSTGD